MDICAKIWVPVTYLDVFQMTQHFVKKQCSFRNTDTNTLCSKRATWGDWLGDKHLLGYM